MNLDRQSNIELLAGFGGNLEELKILFGPSFTQLEIDIALENAIAYSCIEIADYTLELGASFENRNYQAVYYAVHNNEIEGLKYAISKGVNINVNNGMLLNVSIITAINSKEIAMVQWLLENGADINSLTKDSIFLIDKYGTDELKDLIKKAQQLTDK